MAEIHWLNQVDGNWSTASDWSGGVVPGQDDDAFLDASGPTPYTVTLTVGQYLNTLQLASTATLDIDAGLDPLYGVINAGAIIVGPGGIFEPGGANSGMTNSGSIIVDSGGYLIFSGSIDNSGSISMVGSSAIYSYTLLLLKEAE